MRKAEERATKAEEEEAITYSGNRPNCPRPRSYGSPHCRDAGAKRAIPFSVTFSIGADDGARGMEKKEEEAEAESGQRRKHGRRNKRRYANEIK